LEEGTESGEVEVRMQLGADVHLGDQVLRSTMTISGAFSSMGIVFYPLRRSFNASPSTELEIAPW